MAGEIEALLVAIQNATPVMQLLETQARRSGAAARVHPLLVMALESNAAIKAASAMLHDLDRAGISLRADEVFWFVRNEDEPAQLAIRLGRFCDNPDFEILVSLDDEERPVAELDENGKRSLVRCMCFVKDTGPGGSQKEFVYPVEMRRLLDSLKVRQ